MNFHRAKFQARQPPEWPAINGIAASLIYLACWALDDSSSITLGRVAILFTVGIALAQLGCVRLSEVFPNFGLFLAVLGFIVGAIFFKIDGTTDSVEGWKIFGPWFLPGLFFAIFNTHILNAINYVAWVLVLPGIYLAMPVTTVMSESWPQYHRWNGSQSHYSAPRPAPVRRNVVRTAGAASGRGGIAAGVASGAAIAAGAAYLAGDAGGQANDQDMGFQQDPFENINPASGLQTIGGMGSPDIAGNSWCTLDHSCPDVFYEAPFDSGSGGGGGGFSDF